MAAEKNILYTNKIHLMGMAQCTEDGSTEALLQILYGPNHILGVFGSYMF